MGAGARHTCAISFHNLLKGYISLTPMTPLPPSLPQSFLDPFRPLRRVFYFLVKHEGLVIGTFDLDYRVGAAFSTFLIVNGAVKWGGRKGREGGSDCMMTGTVWWLARLIYTIDYKFGLARVAAFSIVPPPSHTPCSFCRQHRHQHHLHPALGHDRGAYCVYVCKGGEGEGQVNTTTTAFAPFSPSSRP